MIKGTKVKNEKLNGKDNYFFKQKMAPWIILGLPIIFTLWLRWLDTI